MTAGIRTMSGSPIFEHRVPDTDAPFVRRLKEAGGVMLGKTTTPEFGWKALGDSPVTGITRNPWNTGMTSGGSSAGAGVAAAAGLGPLHQGSDGAGLDPHPVGLLRHLRPQALVRARADVAGVEHRQRLAHGADDAHRRRRRAHAVGDGGVRPLRPHRARRAARRLRRAASTTASRGCASRGASISAAPAASTPRWPRWRAPRRARSRARAPSSRR